MELDTESDANDGEPLLSDASVSSKRSFGYEEFFKFVINELLIFTERQQ